MAEKEKHPELGAANESPLWKVNDVARFLNMAPQSIYRAVSEKRIPFVKIGGALRFDEMEIRDWVCKLKKKLKRVRVN